MADAFELGTLIGTLREQLISARAEREKDEPLFELEYAEIELKVVACKDAKGGGGVKFLVYHAELGGAAKSEHVQTIRLKLKPCGKDVPGGTGHIPVASEIRERPND